MPKFGNFSKKNFRDQIQSQTVRIEAFDSSLTRINTFMCEHLM
jgi:hypothetical protein